ncbi:MAG: TetR/AcrR family transcriptional regulator [Rhodospirillaceae bacterium]|nr:TetR/AcrR family transcriptional regulator [Rhodospirillaceae bacterium]
MTGPNRTTTRHADSYERTHTRIIEATLESITREGLSATTIQKIADEAGVSTATIIKHFETKENVLQAALDCIAREFEEERAQTLAESEGDPVKYLTLTAKMVLHPKISNVSRIAVWNAFWGEAQARKLYLERIGAIDAEYERTVVRMCRQIARDGDYQEINVEAVAICFVGLLEWLWQEKLAAGDSFNVKRAQGLTRGHLANSFPKHFRR